MKALFFPADAGLMVKKACLTCLVYLAIAFSAAYAFELKVEPQAIMPGDAFVVTVTGLGRGSAPEGVFSGRQLYFAQCGDGCFFSIGAADARKRPGKYVISVNVQAKRRKTALKIVQHKFPVVRLALPPEKVTLSEEDTARAVREEKVLKALWQQCSDRTWEGGFSLPLANEISTQYGVKRIINGKKESIHGGVDIRGREGEEVLASNAGRVVIAEEFFFGGNTLVLDHGMGIFSVYMHLSGFAGQAGDMVKKGEVIGFVGSTGRSTGPHLHFGVKVGELSVNPVSFTKLSL